MGDRDDKTASERLRGFLRARFAEGTTYTDVLRSGALSNGTLARVLEGGNVGLDKLDALAQAFGLEPWQLLHPDFETDAAASANHLSEAALRIARKMEDLPPDLRDKAYALFVQQVDFQNAAKTERASNVHGIGKPRKLHPVRR